MTRTQINARLESAFAQKNVLILAHRGVSGANIVDNTLESYEAALRQGADIVEVDVCQSTDGDLFVLHDGMEPVVLGIQETITSMSTEEVRRLRYLNQNNCRIDHPINTFDEVLEAFHGRCLLNLDRCWVCWETVFRAVERHGMADQILFKSPPEKRYIDQIAATDYMYMPIIWYPRELDGALSSGANVVAVEFIGYREDADIMQPSFIDPLRARGIHRLISTLTLGSPVLDPQRQMERWNAAGSRMAGAILNRNILLSGGHDDDTAVLGDPDGGWGWLVERGFDILQTDWTLLMSQYLKDAGYNPA